MNFMPLCKNKDFKHSNGQSNHEIYCSIASNDQIRVKFNVQIAKQIRLVSFMDVVVQVIDQVRMRTQ